MPRSHTRADRLADEQAALRRVATLVATEPSPPRGVREGHRGAGQRARRRRVLAVQGRARRDRDHRRRLGRRRVGRRSRGHALGPVDGDGVIASVLREDGRAGSATTRRRPGRSPRTDVTGSGSARPSAVRSWSAGASGGRSAPRHNRPRRSRPRPRGRSSSSPSSSPRASANADARTEVERLAAEQAALRRVATLVADGRLANGRLRCRERRAGDAA